MKKMIKGMAIIILLAVFTKVTYKIYIANYEELADVRINKVIQLQGASSKNSKTLIDGYDWINGYWTKRVVFEDDPEITYDYEYSKSDNEIRIWRKYGNASLDIFHKTAKYPEYDVIFEKDKVKEITKR